MSKDKDEILRFFALLRMTSVCLRVALCAGAALYLLSLGVVRCEAQQPIGSVGISDATVSGALEVTNGRAMLRGASTVTAREKTAEIALDRGGNVKVCETSGLHVTAGKGVAETPLMLALDRGAIEIATRANTNDVVMTPDLRFTLKSPGVLDLRMRVARNGDTCVENRGASAPVLSIADQFGETSYELHAGQHVLFEHGSLKEVVDNESEPCGCPPEPVVSVADAGVSGGAPAPGAILTSGATAAEQHPFPAAVSAGLSPASTMPPQAPTGQVHAQVSTTMSYGEGSRAPGVGTDGDAGVAGTNAKSAAHTTSATGAGDASTVKTTSPTPEKTVRAEVPPPPPAPSAGNVFHSIGRFFKRLFSGR
jgi:hypothetical protein